MGEKPADPTARGPKVYKIRLTKVAEINPEYAVLFSLLHFLVCLIFLGRVLQQFVQGKSSHDNSVLTAITVCPHLLLRDLSSFWSQALNVVIRMQPSLSWPFNVRSFFTDRETKDIGSGLVLWRGYFQSVRPAMGRMLINIDISTGTMYRPGRLLDLCLQFIGRDKPMTLAPRHGFPDRERLRLQRFITGIRVLTPGGTPGKEQTPRVIKKLSPAGANSLTFQTKDGRSMTVADYFRVTLNRPLEHPDVLCVEVCLSLRISSCCLIEFDRLALAHSSRWSFARSRLARSCASRFPLISRRTY